VSGVEVVPTLPSGLAEFSYGDLTHEAASIARDAAAGIRSAHKGFLGEVGRHLLRAKDVMEHGTFTRWAQAELGMTDRTARNYMQATRFLEGKPETIAVLPPTILYALSAPTAATEVVQSVVTAAEAGEPLNAKAIDKLLDTAKQRLHQAKQEASELKVAQRRNPKMTQADLKAKREQQRRRYTAEDERRVAEEAKAKRECEERMRPLANAILACPGDMAAALLGVLVEYSQRETLRLLLDAGLREVRS